MDSSEVQPESSSGLKAKLHSLQEAEDHICEVLKTISESCEELERVPFSDSEKLQMHSMNIASLLQKVRAKVVEGIDAVNPAEVEGGRSNVGEMELSRIETLLKSYDNT
jgi:hypothetical protein